MITVPLSSITGLALRGAARARVAQWDWRALNPGPSQTATLLAHCRAAADTAFGRDHGLADVRSAADFRRRVPVRRYADFEPWIDRMRAGQRDVLAPGLVPYLGNSSGSSNTEARQKFLPITLDQIRWQQRAGFDLIARYLVATARTRVTLPGPPDRRAATGAVSGQGSWNPG